LLIKILLYLWLKLISISSPETVACNLLIFSPTLEFLDFISNNLSFGETFILRDNLKFNGCLGIVSITTLICEIVFSHAEEPAAVQVYVIAVSGYTIGFEQLEQDKLYVGDQLY
jgi:hypothetical protein